MWNTLNEKIKAWLKLHVQMCYNDTTDYVSYYYGKVFQEKTKTPTMENQQE